MPLRVIAFLLALGTAAAPAQETPLPPVSDAAASDELAAMRAAVASGEALSLSEIMPAVMAAQPGKIIEIHFQQRAAGPVYVLYDLTPDWQLVVLIVDARTGAILPGPDAPAANGKDQS